MKCMSKMLLAQGSVEKFWDKKIQIIWSAN